LRRLEYLDLATRLDDLKVPPSNRLHKLERDRTGQYSISVNDQWRICFRFVDGDVYEMALRLSRLFGNSPEFWLNAQRAIDLWEAARNIKGQINHISPLNAA
jgi:mRNA-degrading endonuclease YafQ of YafQ-DinJ toxin-antitoxin module